jgi:hypothetical protein
MGTGLPTSSKMGIAPSLLEDTLDGLRTLWMNFIAKLPSTPRKLGATRIEHPVHRNLPACLCLCHSYGNGTLASPPPSFG